MVIQRRRPSSSREIGLRIISTRTRISARYATHGGDFFYRTQGLNGMTGVEYTMFRVKRERQEGGNKRHQSKHIFVWTCSATNGRTGDNPEAHPRGTVDSRRSSRHVNAIAGAWHEYGIKKRYLSTDLQSRPTHTDISVLHAGINIKILIVRYRPWKKKTDFSRWLSTG